MPFEPDIIVSDRDGLHVSLVVEAKLRVADLAAAERALKGYMLGNRCPLGMIVTPETLRLYRDTYQREDEDSIARVAELSATGLFGMGRFDDTVQSWLESIRSPSARSSMPLDLRAVLEEHVVPALFEGDVRAARPRLRHTGS